MTKRFARQVAAEAVGTALLLAAVVGSGIMGARLAGGSEGLALLANSLATGAALVAIILALGPISAHLNPAVTLAEAGRGALPWSAVPALLAAQLAGAFAGVAGADLMFAEPVFAWSTKPRADGGMLLAEGLATFGLVLIVQRTAARGLATTAAAVGCYIAAAYWFASSTSFANPAVTLARAATDTFTGIRPVDVPGFLVAQAAGAGAAAGLGAWLAPAGEPKPAGEQP